MIKSLIVWLMRVYQDRISPSKGYQCVCHARLGLWAICLALVTGCGDSGGDDSTSNSTNNANQPSINLAPIVSAHDDQTVNEATKVTLTGNATDGDGSIVSYLWTQTIGTNVTLLNSSAASASFMAPTLISADTLEFKLTVTDNEGVSSSDTVSITVNPVNAAPSVSAGSDQTVNEATKVTLTGNATDGDGSTMSYQWTQTSGTNVTLLNSSAASASFMAPTLTSADTLEFKLTVTDDEGVSSSDTVSVTVNPVNAAPSVSAGSDQTVNEATKVTLTGSATDGDGSIVSYLWTQTIGTNVTLLNSSAASASFMAPTLTSADTLEFKLTVTDNEGVSSSDTVSVTVNPVNAAPSVSAGSDQTVNEATKVTLTGSATDGDGSIMSYLWTQTSGTNVTLSNSSNASVRFIAPTLVTADTLEFKLTATDNEGRSSSDSVSVTVNAAPVVFTPELNATAGDKAISLSWNPVDGADSYHLYYAKETFSNITSVDNYASLNGGSLVMGLTGTGYALTGLTNDTPYYVTLTAVKDGKESAPSAEVTATPKAPVVVEATGKLNDTGITWGGDYNEGNGYRNNDDCSSNIDAKQDCHQGRDALAAAGQLSKIGGGSAGFDFTKLDSNGNDLSANSAQWDCVRDNVTGLIWEVKTDANNTRGDNLHDADDRYNWYNTDPNTNGGADGYADDDGNICYGYNVNDENSFCNTQAFVKRVNSAGLCGASDWRMPKKDELRSIVDYSRYNPAIDSDYFPNTHSSMYWSGSPFAFISRNAWNVYFNYGYGSTNYRDRDGHVRLVRDGQ
ncbi:PKD domain-containing protein [Marinomonas balearica]|uniref:REJ domain-containing protein n=1 Tax=Marinomonas balearica TaxID=491947 RepID=A0A4R6MDW0_9GAMM|nr:DUF1566 domain-containing protein [Marinomonas balearica]TDO99937.1 REJ domain-containing protein [Marinomonas balearica]